MRVKTQAAPAGIGVAALVGWEAGARLGWLPESFLSRPTEVGAVIWRWMSSGFLWPHLSATLEAMSVGLGLGLLGGMVLGFLAVFVPAVGEVLEPAMGTLNAIPRVVFYPLLALWLGLGIPSKVGLVVTIVLVVAFFNTLIAVREIDRELVARVRILGAPPLAMLRHLYLPAALVWIMASLRTSVGLAFVGTILGEYMGSMRGIGNVIMGAQNLFRTADVMAGLVITLLLAGLIDVVVAQLDARWSAWRQVAHE